MEIGIGDIKRELASSLLKLKHAKRDGNAQRANVLMSKIEACFGELEKYKLLSINDIDFLAESKRKYNLFLKEQINVGSEQSVSGDGISQREIKTDKLKDHFVPDFYNGTNDKKIDYFSENLLPDLKKPFDGKRTAAIASLIYRSNKLRPRVRPKSYRLWLKTFCDLIAVKYTEYKESAVKEECEKLKSVFYYL